MEKVTTVPIQPLKAIQKFIGKQVIIKLKTNKVLRGILVAYDNCMNIVLDEAEEVDIKGDQTLVKYGRVLIRGNQIIYISSQDITLGQVWVWLKEIFK